ncbi:NAD(P)H-quinone oxidoreductase [bacterium]|nr:NAD(P)H-quinone oxidoreductase [bacterium]
MKAIIIKNAGKSSYLEWTEVPMVNRKAGEVIVKVRSTAVNRADLLQRLGLYPPPDGESQIMGLECAGEIVETGPEVMNCKVGDRVCALLAGGGYADYVNIHRAMILPIPLSLSFDEAAAIPEAYYTAYVNLLDIGELKAGETCLIYAGGSGVGTAAIQIAKFVKATVLATAGSQEKMRRCIELGADHVFDHKEDQFISKIQQLTKVTGIDLILDTIGAKHFANNIDLLSYRGRLILIGLLSGSMAEVDLGQVLKKNILMRGSTLRNLPIQEKILLTQKIKSFVLPLFEDRVLKPVIDSVYPIQQIENAHQRMLGNRNFGKIVISMVQQK